MFKFKQSGLVELDVGPDGCLALTFRNGQVSTGNLTGQQLKALHCLEQLQSLLDDRLYPLVKQMAEANDVELQSMLDFASSDMTEFEDLNCSSPASEWRKAISAMAIFCLSEIVERGLRTAP